MDDRAPIGSTPARDTIAAVSTAPGRAAVAVIRMSGPAAGPAIEAIAGPLPPSRRASLRSFRDPQTRELLDRGLLLWMPGPGTQTGEDVAELHVHGGRAVVDGVLGAVLERPGVRLAEPGEFTRRAFLAGRIDLAEAEGLADLLAAETWVQRRQAILQSGGAFSAKVDGWRTRLIEAMALVEAGIDFADEDDVTAAARARARTVVAELAAELADALADTRAERLREGFRIAIVGRPNAGKSSLLNALARRDAAIVAETPGTTRDVVEVHLDLGGYPVSLVDTAGLRSAVDPAEREGVRRAEGQAEAADLVLWVEDALDRAPPDVVANEIWRVVNKADLVENVEIGGCEVAVSARSGTGVDELVAMLSAAAAGSLGSGDGAGPTRARHRDALGAALRELNGALTDWDRLPDELLAEPLRRAATELGRVTGRVGVEDVLGAIFSTFCVGK